MERVFYVYRNEQEYNDGGSWVQFCYNIDYLNGWLYGASSMWSNKKGITD